MSETLDTFVRDALARGADRDAIRAALLEAGWPAGDIDAALASWVDTSFGVPAPRRRVQTSAREAFLYLLMFATLYVVAYNTGALLFAWIGRLLPDAAAYTRWESGLARLVRGATASVLIGLPVFLFVAHHIGGILHREPEKRASGVRRWLTYLTLFLASGVLIGNLIVLVSGLLSGELTLRFVLKVIVVFLIAAFVFGHYMSGVRGDESEVLVRAGGARRWMARVAGLCVALTAVVGLWMSGGPGVGRAEALDAKRSRNLNEIMLAVRGYAGTHDALPESLGALREFRPGSAVSDLEDPVTKEPYEYRIIDEHTFELCAMFERKAESRRQAVGENVNFWEHPAGRTCFRLSVPMFMKERLRSTGP